MGYLHSLLGYDVCAVQALILDLLVSQEGTQALGGCDGTALATCRRVCMYVSMQTIHCETQTTCSIFTLQGAFALYSLTVLPPLYMSSLCYQSLMHVIMQCYQCLL